MGGNKRIWAGLLCLLLMVLCLPGASLAAEESGYRIVIEDEADLLSEAEEAELRQAMEGVLPYGNAAFLSTKVNPTTPEQYIQDRFLALFGDAPGVILLIDMGNRYIQLSSHGSVRKQLGSARCDEITDNIYRYASKGDYAACARQAFGQVTRVLGGDRVPAPFRYATNALLALCLGVLGNFCVVNFQRRKKVAPENALNVEVAVNTATSARRVGAVAAVALTMLNQRRTKHVESSGGGGGRSGGGGHSGGGHSSGGFSGGGHRF